MKSVGGTKLQRPFLRLPSRPRVVEMGVGVTLVEPKLCLVVPKRRRCDRIAIQALQNLFGSLKSVPCFLMATKGGACAGFERRRKGSTDTRALRTTSWA